MLKYIRLLRPSWRSGSSDTILKEDHLSTIPPEVDIHCLGSFGEVFLKKPPYFLVTAAMFMVDRDPGYNFERGPFKDHSTKVWLKLTQWFQRRLKVN